ncbi:MAG: AAA family ATPase [Anaerolineaceae bacterium]
MIPIRLRISGFTSYNEDDPADIDFTSFDLACISGTNGAGKSSLLDAITYALYGEARKRDEGIINVRSQKAEVVLDFGYENQQYRVRRSITRGKGSQLEFYIHNPAADSPETAWKVLTERTLTETQNKIRQTLRLDYETFVNASFFLQGKADSFAIQRPADRKRILSEILGLGQWDAYKQRAAELAREKNGELALVNSRLDEVQAELALEEERKARLAALEDEVELMQARVAEQRAILEKQRADRQRLQAQAQTVELLRQQMERSKTALQDVQQRLEEKQNQWGIYEEEIANAAQIEQAYTDYLNLREQLSNLDTLAALVKPVEQERAQFLTKLENRRAELAQEVLMLEAEETHFEAARAQLPEQKKALDELEGRIEQLSAALAARDTFEVNVKQLQEEAVRLSDENGALRSRMNDIKERMNKVEAFEGGSCPFCGQPLSEHDRDRLAEELQAEGTKLGDQHRANQVLIEANKNKQESLSIQRSDLERQNRELQEVQKEYIRLTEQISQQAVSQQEWESGKAPRLKQARLVLQQETYLPEERSRISDLEIQLKDMGYDVLLHDRLRAEESQARVAQEHYHQLGIARTQADSLQGIVADLKTSSEKATLEAEQSLKVFQQAAAQLAADSTGQPDIHQSEQTLTSLLEDEAELNRKLGGAKQELLAIDMQRERRVNLKAQADTLRDQITHLKSLDKAFGKDGVPAMLIEQALPELEEQANDILQRLSNYTMSVSFATQRAFKDSKREDKKETLDILISDGASTRDYETYSGGEAFRVNFAIRLALSRVLARRAGARLQTLVIDEGFGNQDTEGRQRLIEAINLVQHDFAKVLIITHIEELKEQFPSRLEISKGPLGSRVELITA